MTLHAHHRTMNRTRRFGHLLALALGILVAITTLVAAPLASAAAQNPNKPVTEYVDVTFPAPNLTAQCGVPITARVSGTVTVKLLPNGVELQKIRFQHVFSGPGGSVTVDRTENVKFTTTLSPDGSFVDTFTITGTLMYHQVLPGHGSIANNSGREILQFSWQYDEVAEEWILIDEQVLFDAGPNDDTTDADFAVICAQLV